jgi:hypothetical protein
MALETRADDVAGDGTEHQNSRPAGRAGRLDGGSGCRGRALARKQAVAGGTDHQRLQSGEEGELAEVTLEFLGAQMERMFGELREMRAELRQVKDDLDVLTGIVLRLEGRDVETRGLFTKQRQIDRRLDEIEARVRALETERA